MHPRSTKGPLLITTAAVCRSDRSRLQWLLKRKDAAGRSNTWTMFNGGHFVPVCVAGTTSYIFKQMSDDQLPWLSLSNGKQRHWMLVECRPDFSFWSSLPLLLFKRILTHRVWGMSINSSPIMHVYLKSGLTANLDSSTAIKSTY